MVRGCLVGFRDSIYPHLSCVWVCVRVRVSTCPRACIRVHVFVCLLVSVCAKACDVCDLAACLESGCFAPPPRLSILSHAPASTHRHKRQHCPPASARPVWHSRRGVPVHPQLHGRGLRHRGCGRRPGRPLPAGFRQCGLSPCRSAHRPKCSF